jgi:putative NADH-flavin reductase
MAGDALEMATVKRALSGVDVVIQSLGVSAGPEIIFEPTRLFSKATRVLVTAMEKAHVSRLICVTGFGAGDSRGRGGFLYNVAFHLLLARIYDDKDVQEWIIRRSKLDWVIARPVILTDGPKTTAYRALVDPRDWTCGFISRADVETPFCIRRRCLRAPSELRGVSPHCRRAAEQRDEFARSS